LHAKTVVGFCNLTALPTLVLHTLDNLALLIQSLVVERVLARLLARFSFAPCVDLLLDCLQIKADPPLAGIKNHRFAFRIALAHGIGSLEFSVFGRHPGALVHPASDYTLVKLFEP
jgi:hypothetical protein